MNKKGISLLGNNIVGIVIAVMCLLVLFYLGWMLWGFFGDKQDLKIAEIHMGNIMGIINDLEDGETENYYLYSPNMWVLTGWPFEGKYPNQCTTKGFDKCLCMCIINWHISDSEKVLDGCNTLSVCEEINFNEYVVEYKGEHSPIKIDTLVKDGQELEIKLQDGKLTIKPVTTK